MAEPTTIRLRWLTSQGTTSPVVVPVRRVSERSAFAKLATSHGPGTRGNYELLDSTGTVVREGSCRIIFQRQGAGIGLELLAKPPLRRSSAPSRPPVPASDAPPKLEPPAPRRNLSTQRTLAGAKLGDELSAKVGDELKATDRPERRASPQVGKGHSSPGFVVAPKETSPSTEEAPESILGSRPPRTRRLTEPGLGVSSADTVSGEQATSSEPPAPGPPFKLSSPLPAPTRAGQPSSVPPEAPTSSAPPEAPEFDLSVDPDDATMPFASVSAAPAAFDIENDEAPSGAHVSFPPIVHDPDVPVEETEHSSAETEPPPAFELPDLPKWEAPPPSEPPPRYDPGSWEPPVYEPGALDSAGPEAQPAPPSPTSDAVELSEAPEPIYSTAPPRQRSSLTPSAPALRESRSPLTSARPRDEEPSSAAAQSQRKARVATRVSGTGASTLAIGIDLGTSNTCASAVIDGVPQVIPTRFGTNTVPSVLTVIDSRVVVGHAAAKRMIMNPHETIYGSKRLVGRAFTSEVADEYQSSFAYPLVETDDHRFGASLKGRIISFEQVAEYLLAEVRDVAEQHLNQKVHSAVITVPAYFGEAQREAIRRAARGAQLSVDRIVPEPTAAAVAYGYDAQEEHTLVVFDLGGGTFDVSVLKVGKNRFEVLATGGDAFLGGIDVDDLIANYLIEEFQRTERTTLEPNPQQLARLRDAAEHAKRDLSVQMRVAVNLQHFARVGGVPRELRATLTRETLDELSTSLVERLIAITAATLSDCRLSAHDIDDVLLVGGMTRMAIVPQRVEEFFGQRPSRRINPDEAVALGAARLAESGGKVQLLDVLPLSIGVASEGRAFQRLIPRNLQVPLERSFTVRTTEVDQDTYRLPLFQGERPDAAENEYLGTLMVEEIPPGPAGSELELLLVLDEQCFLEVRAAHVASGHGLAVYINREEGAEKAIAALESYTGPKKDKKKKEAKGLGRFFKRLRKFFS